MWPIKALCLLSFSTSPSLWADTIEERAATLNSPQSSNPFQLNPSALPTDRTVIGGLKLNHSLESNYLINPNNNPSKVRVKSVTVDNGASGQLAMGGAAIGFAAGEYTRKIQARAEGNSSIFLEEFSSRAYQMKFVVDLLPDLRAGFGFRYQSVEADLLGAYNLNVRDRSRYKGNLSGYALGLNYRSQNFMVGAYTAPPLRGKIIVESEQKIISDPGVGGLDAGFLANERLLFGLTVRKHYYKKDDRDDDATSPADQRGIMLRGLEVDQYFRKTSSVALGFELGVTAVVGLKAGIEQQEGVFLFDFSKLPLDDKLAETRLKYEEIKLGVVLRNKQFFAEFMLAKSSRDKSEIKINRNNANLREISDYKSSESSQLIVLGGTF